MVVDKSLLNTGQTEESLKALCLEFISSLKDAYENGFITEDEYFESIRTKIQFLRRGLES